MIRSGGVHPWSDGRHHAIAQAGHRGDIGGLAGIVAEQTAERGHSLIDGVGRDVDAGPDLVEEGIDADDLAGVLGKTEKQAQRSCFKANGLAFTGDFAGSRMETPGADAERCRCWAFGAGWMKAVTHGGRRNEVSPIVAAGCRCIATPFQNYSE